MFKWLIFFIVKKLGTKRQERYRRVYMFADWHFYDRNVEVKLRVVHLHSQVRMNTTYQLGEKVLDEGSWPSGREESLYLVEGEAAEQLEGKMKAFFEAANPDKLELCGETHTEHFPELTKRVINFLTRKSNVIAWGGWTTVSAH